MGHAGSVTQPFPSPMLPVGSRSEVLLGYLDYFRSQVAAKVEGLPCGEARRTRLPSGWTPLELVRHLTYVELRWLEWGFQGRQVDDPWGDQPQGRWHVGDDETPAQVLSALRAQGRRSRAVVEGSSLDALGRPGPRWEGAQPPTLERILLHLVQEYARHLGHLDIVAELAAGPLGE